MRYSVIVPVYKAERYIHNCIESILGQTYTDFEVILVNDGSPDSSPQICDEFAAIDRRVQVVHKKNGGVVSARNAGLSAAQGNYVVFVDADDWIANNLLEELSTVIDEHNEPDMVLFELYKVYEGRKERDSQFLEPGYYDKEAICKKIVPHMIYDTKRAFLVAMISGYFCNKAIKKKHLMQHYCNDESLYKCEDFACVYECIYFSNSLFYLNKGLYFYNKCNDNSAMTRYDESYFRNHERVIKYVMEHLGKYSEVVKEQIIAQNVSGICIGVFHEVRHGKKIMEARRHIKKELEETTCLKMTDCKSLPIYAKTYIFLLKHKFYLFTLLLAKFYLRITEKK